MTAASSEGFGLPLLEAAAAGLAVVAPMGGAAEEILSPTFARYVPSAVQQAHPHPTTSGTQGVLPGFDPLAVNVRVQPADLAAAMLSVALDAAFRNKAATAGPAHVAGKFSLAAAADVLLGVLQDNRWEPPNV